MTTLFNEDGSRDIETYVCMITEGSYSDAEEYPIIAFTDENKAKEWVENTEKAIDKLRNFHDEYKNNIAPNVLHEMHSQNKSDEEKDAWVREHYYQASMKLIKESGLEDIAKLVGYHTYALRVEHPTLSWISQSKIHSPEYRKIILKDTRDLEETLGVGT